jgi:hypothetical protein
MKTATGTPLVLLKTGLLLTHLRLPLFHLVVDAMLLRDTYPCRLASCHMSASRRRCRAPCPLPRLAAGLSAWRRQSCGGLAEGRSRSRLRSASCEPWASAIMWRPAVRRQRRWHLLRGEAVGFGARLGRTRRRAIAAGLDGVEVGGRARCGAANDGRMHRIQCHKDAGHRRRQSVELRQMMLNRTCAGGESRCFVSRLCVPKRRSRQV